MRLILSDRGDVLHEPDARLQELHRLYCLPDDRASRITEPKPFPFHGPGSTWKTTRVHVDALKECVMFFMGGAVERAISEVPGHHVISHVEGLVVRISESAAGKLIVAEAMEF